MHGLDAIQDPIAWLECAAEDVRISRKCLAIDEYTLRGAIYHAQQACEKSLKAFLVLHKKPAPKIHALMPLLEACIASHHEFILHLAAIENLSSYATEVRYPANARIIERIEAEECIETKQQMPSV